MGFTQYYYKQPILDLNKWNDFLNEVKHLYANLPKHSFTAGGYYKEEPLKIKGGQGKGKPVFDEKKIWFNGDATKGLDHETFYLPRVSVKNDWEYPRSNGEFFYFTKTARKPYDLLVCLVLISAKNFFGDCIKVSSDGDIEDWQPVIEIYENLTEKSAPKDLFKKQEEEAF